jgi:hypothetical protein
VAVDSGAGSFKVAGRRPWWYGIVQRGTASARVAQKRRIHLFRWLDEGGTRQFFLLTGSFVAAPDPMQFGIASASREWNVFLTGRWPSLQ